ncbi:unnamed protein product [Acidithrix sp. C25]|nr:cupredoxin domain-containing protein [Acidithrix sp. C25]CAG4911040.1 unnamed protein product [Acidithrix sp. C25]
MVAGGLGWWFFGPKHVTATDVVAGIQTVRVTVRGGYTPNRILAHAGVPLHLVFDRQESGDCTSRVIFPDFGVSAELPTFGEASLDFTPARPGEYGFVCGMNMIHGFLIVEDQATQDQGDTLETTVIDATHTDNGATNDKKIVVTEIASNKDKQIATIIVDGGYRPDKVGALRGLPLSLIFDRREDGACSDRVVLASLGIDLVLPAHEKTTVDLGVLEVGIHEISCGENMLHATIEVINDDGSWTRDDLKSATTTKIPVEMDMVKKPSPPPSQTPVIVPPVVRDGSGHPSASESEVDEDSEDAERLAEITDL